MQDAFHSALGERIRALRRARGLTQDALADLVGVQALTIKRYEKGERVPNLQCSGRIASALQVPLNELLSTTSESKALWIRSEPLQAESSAPSADELRVVVAVSSYGPLIPYDAQIVIARTRDKGVSGLSLLETKQGKQQFRLQLGIVTTSKGWRVFTPLDKHYAGEVAGANLRLYRVLRVDFPGTHR